MLLIPWAHGTASAQRGPFSNVTKAPQRPTKAPCMSSSWGGEERQASKVASTLSGADRDSSFLRPSLAPVCPSPLWLVCGHSTQPCRGPAWKDEKEFLLRARSRLNQKEKEGSERRVWIRRQTATSVSGIQIAAASALYTERPFGGDHPSGRSPLPRAFLSYK